MSNGIKPVAQTYYEISDVKHTKVKKPLDYSQKAFTYLKNAYTDEVLTPISLNDLGQLINEYNNAKGGKFADRCLLKGLYKNGFSGADCYQNAPYLFFDIDVKEKKENTHLLKPVTNEVIFKELQKIAVICWRSNSGNGMAGVFYVPQLATYLEPDKDLHLLAGKVITKQISQYLYKQTGIERVSFDPAQSKFRQVRFLAEQKKYRKLNPYPFKFSYKAEKKIKYKEAGVIDYRRSDFKSSYGSIYTQFDNDNDILNIALDNGFKEVSVNGSKTRVLHHTTTSGSSGEIDQQANVYYNYSGSFYSQSLSSKKTFTPSSLLCYTRFNNDWAKFRAHLNELGYKEKAKDKDEVKTVSKGLKDELSKAKNKDEAGKIIFKYCYDLQTLTPKQKHQFIKDNCTKPELKRYFKAYLNLVNYKIEYDKKLLIKDWVSEKLPEILNYADQHGKTILRAETGKGKTTALFSIFDHRPNARVLVLEPLTVIVDQNRKDYKDKAVFLDSGSTPAEWERAEHLERLVFATYEQGTKLLQVSKFDYIVIDEVHQLITANSFKRNVIAELTPHLNDQSTIIGLTGTPTDIFKRIGFKIIEADVKRPVRTPAEVRFSNSRPFDLALSHLRNVKGKTLLRFNDINGLKALKKQLVNSKLYTFGEILIFYSTEQIKNSKDFKQLAHQRRFDDKIRLVLTTSLIDEGLSIDQNGFTDIVFLETSYTPRPEAIKQFFARFRNIDPDRKNYLYLRTKKNQNPSRFNAVWAYNDTLQGLKNEINELINEEVKSTYNGVFSNDPYYYEDNSINPYYLAYSVTDVLFNTLNNEQFLNYLEENYNLHLSVNDKYQPNFENLQSIEKDYRKKIKTKSAKAWILKKDEVLQVLVLHTQSNKIKKKLNVKQIALSPELEAFVIDQIKAFEKLYNDSEKLKELGCTDPDQVLITGEMDKDGAINYTLTSTKKVKDEFALLTLQNMIEKPKNKADKMNAFKVIKFADWCNDQKEFTTAQMNRKLKELRIYKNSAYSFEMIKRVLNWFELEADKNTKTKLIKVSGKVSH